MKDLGSTSYPQSGRPMLHTTTSPTWRFDQVNSRPAALGELELPDTPALYGAHAAFVWRSLVRLGVPECDREDLLQEVFVVVHRSRHAYRGRGKVTTWLYGISLRVAGTYRRRRRVRNEVPAEPANDPVEHRTPERVMDSKQRAALLGRILDRLSPKQRTVFVMFELEALGCDQIADELGVPVGTVYSRLHAARERFAAIWREEERSES